MSTRDDVEEQFKKLGTRQKPSLPSKLYEQVRARDVEAFNRKIRAQIDDEQKASKKYFNLSVEAKLIDAEIASKLYEISGEEFVHKTELEQIYRKLGGKI